MDDRILLWIVVLAIKNVASMFFHEPSPVMVQPTFKPNHSDFGFSIAFQDTIPPKLIVGAPRSDFIGKVHKCSIPDIEQPVSCDKLDIDMQKLANYSLELNPNQNFFLGASIAATPDNFLTCAPLWTSPVTKDMGRVVASDVYGTCFMYQNDTFERYKGSYERFYIYHKYRMKHGNREGNLVGGTGWNTLLDNKNKLIFIAKTSLIGDIVYVPSKTPLSMSTALIDIETKLYHASAMEHFGNMGIGLAAGNFLSNSTVYAFSMIRYNMTAQIAFFKYTGNKRQPMEFIKKRNKIFTIENKVIGSMFGRVLSGADLNGDGYSELIVGAPAECDDDELSEQGAMYIFIGGDMEIDDNRRMRAIFGTEDGGRFGSAIITSDMDGDGIPEIFVSSPQEDSGSGAVYVLSGREVKEKLLVNGTNQQILLTDLKRTQRLQAEGSRTFGHSLQILSDLDDNGCNEIAIGSPGQDSVMLFRCIPTIHVSLSTQLLGAQFVKESADNFTVEVCATVEYQAVSSAVAGNLIVTTAIMEHDASIRESNFSIDISKKKPKYCNNVLVVLNHKGPGVNNFIASLQLDLIKNKTILKTREFNKTWITLRGDSETSSSLKVVRRCDAVNCSPELSMSLEWTGPDKYTLGTSENETVTVKVVNAGHDSYHSCVWVGVVGALVKNVGCSQHGGGYRCPLPIPLEKNNSETIVITLDMSRMVSTQKSLNVEARLYELCDVANYTTKILNIPYKITIDQIHITGSSKPRNISEAEITDKSNEIINDDHEYEIINTGSVKWLSMYVVIAMEKKPYIETYNISSLKDCTVRDEANEILYSCTFTLMPKSSVKAIAIMGIQKDKIISNLVDGKISTVSQITLHPPTHIPTLPAKTKNVTKEMTYLKDTSIVNNLPLIITSAIILAILLLCAFIFILYKANFFKRKQREKLDELRESVRRRSVKRNNPPAPEQSRSDDDSGSMEVIEVCPSRVSPTTNDEDALIKEQEES